MKHDYPNLRAVLPAYYNQDFSLDYEDIFEAADEILVKNMNSSTLPNFLYEVKVALDADEELDENFFEELGLDTIPCDTKAEGVLLFNYILRRYKELKAGV